MSETPLVQVRGHWRTYLQDLRCAEEKEKEEMNPKLEPYSFGSLPVGAIFHDGKLLCVKTDKTHADWYDRCPCGKLQDPIRDMPMNTDKQIDAECV